MHTHPLHMPTIHTHPPMFLPPRLAYGAKFADPADPLLFSVRSGAAVSMPVSALFGLLASTVILRRLLC